MFPENVKFILMKISIVYTILLCIVSFSLQGGEKPLDIAVISLTHTHVHWIFNSEKRGDIRIVGVVEPDTALAGRYARQYNVPANKLFRSIPEMLAKVKPEAVAAFGTIADHVKVVEEFAPMGIHIMVEKPLAITAEEGRHMQALAAKHRVQLLVNYETTWYPTVHETRALLDQNKVGPMVQLIVRDGHKGPQRINISNEFFSWLTDPVLNGGGAITDFGCYGANIATWLLKGQRPKAVMAVTQQLQPSANPRVDDEATIILIYDSCKVTLQPSWNWPIGRKDMELYGRTGAIYADNKHDLRVRMSVGYDGFNEQTQSLPDRKHPYDDPFAFFQAVVRKTVKMDSFDLSSIENNILVMEILDAARQSAREGRMVHLSDAVPVWIKGSFTDDYNIKYAITDSLWTQKPGTKYWIVNHNAAEQYLLVRNDVGNSSEAGLFSRIDYMPFQNMAPFTWGFCLTTYDAKTPEEARTKAKADRSNPRKGCNGFPFSRMKQ